MKKVSPRSLAEIRLDDLLTLACSNAMSKAAQTAFAIDGFDEKSSPTSLRLSKRTLTFFDVLAQELKISRNSAIELVLDQVVASSLQTVT